MGLQSHTTLGGFPVLLTPADRRGWFRPVEPFTPDQLNAVLAYPGVFRTYPTRQRPVVQYWIAWGLAKTRPDLFTLPVAPAIPQGEKLVGAPLRDYQRSVVTFGLCCGGGGVFMGLEMGLGKSRAAAAIAIAEGHERVLIAGPKIARGSWCGEHSELHKAFGFSATPLSGRKHIHEQGMTQLARPGWFFAHYDVLAAWSPYFLSVFRPTCVVWDELDTLRNWRSKVSRQVRAVARLATVSRRIGLTGTAIHNSRMDLWPQLDAIEPDAWGDVSHFLRRWCGGFQDTYGWHEGEPTNQLEFQNRLRRVYVRLTRKEVLKDLPPITRQRIDVEPSPEAMEEYNAAFKDIRGYLLAHGGKPWTAGTSADLAKWTALMRTIALAKVDATVAQAQAALASGQKVVVFSWFRDSARKIAKALHVRCWDGDTDVDDRLGAAAEFADIKEPTAFVATTAAAGVALNGLQCAETVIISDLWWTPAKLLQAEGRVYRQGQLNPVSAYYGVALGTVDESLIETLLEKAAATLSTTGADDSTAMGEVLDRGAESDADALGRFVGTLSARIAGWEEARPC